MFQIISVDENVSNMPSLSSPFIQELSSYCVYVHVYDMYTHPWSLILTQLPRNTLLITYVAFLHEREVRKKSYINVSFVSAATPTQREIRERTINEY